MVQLNPGFTPGRVTPARSNSSRCGAGAAFKHAVALAVVTLGDPANSIREVAGPEAAPLAEFVRRWLRKQGDTSRIMSGADVPYFGAPLALRTLVPADGARIMPTRFDDWLGRAP